MSYVIGIDPGIHGAIAVYNHKAEQLIQVADIPLAEIAEARKNSVDRSKHPTGIDIYALTEIVQHFSREIDMVVIEQVSGMVYRDKTGQLRGQGSAASFNFGKYYGIVLGIMGAHRVNIFFAQPAVWKAAMNLTSNKVDSLKMALEKFPTFADKFRLKQDDGKAEAALLAFFGATRILNQNNSQISAPSSGAI